MNDLNNKNPPPPQRNLIFQILDIIVVIQAIGSAPQKLSAYLRTYTGNVHCQVVSVDEDDETADALRAIKDKIDVNEILFDFTR